MLGKLENVTITTETRTSSPEKSGAGALKKAQQIRQIFLDPACSGEGEGGVTGRHLK
jgi:hypothetical protein